MYKQEKPELEEYLLGRKIDKHIDEDASQETESREFFSYTSCKCETPKHQI